MIKEMIYWFYLSADLGLSFSRRDTVKKEASFDAALFKI
jgi:hypothetical protein